MTRKHVRTGSTLIVISLILIAVFSSCRAGPVGIFASIAQETDINASRTAAFDGTSPDFVGILGANYYTIINRTIWSRAVNGGSWGKLSTLPPGVSKGTASSATIAGSNLFVTFGLIGDSSQEVWYTADGTNWVTTGFPTTEKVDSLLSANGQAFAVTRADTTVDTDTTTLFSVYHWNGTNFVSAGTDFDTGISSRPTSMAYGLANYWLTAGQAVYRGSTEVNLATLTAGDDSLPTDSFAGVTTLDATVIFSTTSGKLYTFDGSVTWSGSGVFEKSDLPRSLAKPVIVQDGAKDYLLVGTVYKKDSASASGYLEIDVTGGLVPSTATAGTGSDFATSVNFQTSVSTNYIPTLTVADEGSGKIRVFALTIGNGLWSNYFDGSAWSGWARE